MTGCYKCHRCQAYRPPVLAGLTMVCAACGAPAGLLCDDEAHEEGAPLPLARETLRVRRLDPRAIVPSYAHELDAGLGLYALTDMDILPTDGRVKVPLGLALGIPAGHEGQVRGRSGLTARGLTVHLGTVDAGYTGEVSATVQADQWVRIPYGTAIAQLVVAPVTRCAVVEAAELEQRDGRGSGGFGSTDKKG